MSAMSLMQRQRPDRDRGFTLVEVMVALLVVSVALPALMWQLGSQTESLLDLRHRVVAAWVAEEQQAYLDLIAAAGAALDTPLSQGTTEMLGEQWPWVIDVEATNVPGMMKRSIYVGEPALAMNSISPDSVRSEAVIILESWFVRPVP